MGKRDAEGRPHDAPAWSGDITMLTDDELHQRIEALGSHIGRLSTLWRPGEEWSLRPDFAAQAEPWARKRLACLVERTRRESTIAGG